MSLRSPPMVRRPIFTGLLRRFPHDKLVYELTYNYAESLYYSQRFAEAIPKYQWVRDAKHNTTLKRRRKRCRSCLGERH